MTGICQVSSLLTNGLSIESAEKSAEKAVRLPRPVVSPAPIALHTSFCVMLTTALKQMRCGRVYSTP